MDKQEDNDHIESQFLEEPFAYMSGLHGKQFRQKLVETFNVWFDLPEDKVSEISEVVEAVHNVSLLLDDIEDASDFRRGSPAAHLIFGIRAVFGSASHTIQNLVLKLKDSFKGADKLARKASLKMHRGQAMEIYWRDNFICPTVEEYKLMATGKASTPFMLVGEFMQLVAHTETDLTRLTDLGESLGLFFQIRDDYLNLTSESYATQKILCEDISEGKFSFPIIHAINARPEDKRILNILKQKTKDIDTKKHCLALIKEFGGLDYTYKVLTEMKNDLFKQLEYLPKNEAFENFLSENILNILVWNNINDYSPELEISRNN